MNDRYARRNREINAELNLALEHLNVARSLWQGTERDRFSQDELAEKRVLLDELNSEIVELETCDTKAREVQIVVDKAAVETKTAEPV